MPEGRRQRDHSSPPNPVLAGETIRARLTSPGLRQLSLLLMLEFPLVVIQHVPDVRHHPPRNFPRQHQTGPSGPGQPRLTPFAPHTCESTPSGIPGFLTGIHQIKYAGVVGGVVTTRRYFLCFVSVGSAAFHVGSDVRVACVFRRASVKAVVDNPHEPV